MLTDAHYYTAKFALLVYEHQLVIVFNRLNRSPELITASVHSQVGHNFSHYYLSSYSHVPADN